MDVTPTASALGLAQTQNTPESANLGRDTFLQLFVTQLQNQDPLEPQGNEAFLAQLAQFSSLEILENLNSGFATLNSFQQVAQASALLGKDVTFTNPLTGSSETSRVQSVRIAGGEAFLNIGSGEIPYAAVQEISEPAEEDEE